jgi:hypothetical protein
VALLAWPASSYLWHEYRAMPIPPRQRAAMAVALTSAIALSLWTFWSAMRRGVRALEALG